MSHTVTTDEKKYFEENFCIETYNWLKSICHRVRFYLWNKKQVLSAMLVSLLNLGPWAQTIMI